MSTAYEVYQRVLTLICMGGFIAISALVAVVVLAVYLAPIVRWIRRHKADAILVAPFVIGFIFYGGSKGVVSFPFTDVEQRYLYDAGSYVTNGYARIRFTALLLPQTANIYAYSRPNGSTNDNEWVERMYASLAELAMPSNIYGRDLYYEGAENSDVVVFTDFQTGPTVHTNGVAVVFWQLPEEGATNKAAMVRTGVWIDGIKIAPDSGLTNNVSELKIEAVITNEEEDL